MVKTTSSQVLKKSELVALLQTATTSKKRNRACKLLKKFEPNPKHDLDDEADAKNMKPKEYSVLQAFVCYRCDKVKQSNIKVQWTTSRGVKVICYACHSTLQNNQFIDQSKRILDKAAANVAKGRF